MEETATIIMFNILLPTIDTWSDMRLVIKLYKGAHTKLATVMFLPFLLNYVWCFFSFFRREKNNFKKIFTFIFPLLNLYPQYGKQMKE